MINKDTKSAQLSSGMGKELLLKELGPGGLDWRLKISHTGIRACLEIVYGLLFAKSRKYFGLNVLVYAL